MAAAPHQLARRVLADQTGNAVACVVEQTVYTYDGEDVTAVLTEANAELDSALQATGRAWVTLPATAAKPTPGRPFPKKA